MAHENLLATFEDYYLAKTGNQPTLDQKKEIVTIISYNIFQMEGLKKSVHTLLNKIHLNNCTCFQMS